MRVKCASHILFLIAAVFCFLNTSAHADLIDFSDQSAAGEPPVSAKTLSFGPQMTFTNFNLYDGIADHTPNADNISAYGNGDDGPPYLIDFSAPVIVPSLYVLKTQFSGGNPTVTGLLSGATVWTFDMGPGNENRNVWTEITAGAGMSIDQLEFTAYGDTHIDDITVNDGGSFVPGDVNGDGFVTIDDYTIIKNNFFTATGATQEMGDLTFDGRVDLADYAVWKNAASSATVAGLGVPEPTALACASVMGGVLLLAGARCRRS
jgi:hypothetical protein